MRRAADRESEHLEGIWFGRTLLCATTGRLVDQRVEALACPANRRGVMGAGMAGAVRLAGGLDVEREAMSHAPLTIGAAITTGPGHLQTAGVKAIIHAVVTDALGAPTRKDIVRTATTAVLQEVDQRRIHSLAIPPLGTGIGPGRLQHGTVAIIMVEEMVAHLRRFTSRLDRIVVVCHDERDVAEWNRIIREAKELWWGLRG